MKLSKRYGNDNIGIYFAEDEDPLDWATFGAFASRNNGPFEELLEKVTSGSKKRIIEQTYIGYGHASIGDMVDVKIFLEGVPIWFAFELEGFSRFRGQESSTRYIDFSNQKLLPYYSNVEGWYDEKIRDYVQASTLVYENLKQAIPKDADDRVVHEKAVKARTFDICRGLIPSICTTNVVWYGSINEIRQHLSYMSDFNKGDGFINEIVNALNLQYPETIPEKKVRWRLPWASPAGTQNPYRLFGKLDFGSYRDLRRHRVGQHRIIERQTQRIYPWYEEMLNAHGIGVKITDQWTGGKVQFTENVPLLGNTLSIEYNCDEPQAKYISLLRTKTNVHATLRTLLIDEWGNNPEYTGQLKAGMTLTPDIGPYGYYLVRGTETVEVKA